MTQELVLIDNILVPHGAFQTAQRRIGQCFSYVEAGASEPVCIALIGESRTGKSRCAEVFSKKHPTVRLDDGMRVPILCITIPSKPTVPALAELALQALGATDWEKGTENAKTTRLELLMKKCQVLALVLDEFHHFYDKSSQKVQHHVADWLKNLVGKTKVALIVSGLPSLKAVIDQNEQLAGRFMAPIHMPRFDWLNDEHRAEWFAILGAFSEGISPHFEMPELDSDDMALRVYCATGGLMGYLTNTLRQAVWNAVARDTKVITLKDLEVAHRDVIWSHARLSHLPNPFDRKCLVYPSAEILAQTRLIGVVDLPEEPVPAPRRRRPIASVLASR
jgi:hypothetical protein